MKTIALVPAAGQGLRLGEAVPKAFVTIEGRTLLQWAVEGLSASKVIDEIVVAVPRQFLLQAQEMLPEQHIIVGDVERAESVRAGLEAVGNTAKDAEWIVVHDAARPFAPSSLTCSIVAALHSGYQAVVPVLRVADTVKVVDASGVVMTTADREQLRAVQTPQGFSAEVLRAAYAAYVQGSSPVSDDAGLVERLGIKVHTIPGDPRAFKVTYPTDIMLAQALVRGGS